MAAVRDFMISGLKVFCRFHVHRFDALAAAFTDIASCSSTYNYLKIKESEMRGKPGST